MPKEVYGYEKVYKQLSCFYRDYPPNEWYWLVSYSGGKDSTTLLLLTLRLAKQKGFELGVVYNDDGGDLPELRELVRRVLTYVEELGYRTYITKPEMSFFDYLLTKYSPPRWNFRWCCKRLKERPFKRFVESIKGRKILNLVGTRREEARWRGWSKKVVNEGLVYAAPLRDLKSDDVWALLREVSLELRVKWIYRGLREVYRGAKRTGCWFCPLVMFDEMLLTRPELLRLKLEIFESWCSGERLKILELSKKYPGLVKVSVSDPQSHYPCGKRCRICQVRLIRKTLRDLIDCCTNCL
jgi:3'-phosphoadenosine 5'-phosphosulfate sulfotransferase (PAPS reductase)/FAD synthetase